MVLRGTVSLLLLASAAARPQLTDPFKRAVEEGGNTIWAQHSGSLLVFNSAWGIGDQYALELQLLRLDEVDVNGGLVGTPSNPHTFSFSKSVQAFNFREFTNPTKTGTFGNLSAQGVKMYSSKLGRVGSVEYQAFILQEAGSIGPVGESIEGEAGDVHLRVKLGNWYFCGRCFEDACQCDGNMGSFVDVRLELTGYMVGSQIVDGELGLGGGVALEPLRAVVLDDKMLPMPPGFPNVNKQVLSVRLPIFQESAEFDVILRLNWSTENPSLRWWDVWLLFGPPTLVIALSCLIICTVCQPRRSPIKHMEKQLQRARQNAAPSPRKKQLAAPLAVP